MKVKESTLQRCKEDGEYFEELFKQKVEAKGLVYKKSTQQDDWYRHIDCYVNGYGVDIKGNRHFEKIWLEYTNVNGNNGWLRGQALYIAMHISELNAFSIYFREELLKFVESNVQDETTNPLDYFKFYTRRKWEKKDMIVKVRYNDIKHLELDLI